MSPQPLTRRQLVTRLINHINSVLASDKYKAIKKQLTKTFNLSKREQVLPSPFQSTRRHKTVNADGRNASLTWWAHFLFPVRKQLFLKQLPEDLHAHLVNTKWDNLCQLAKRADALWSCHETISVNPVHWMSKPQGQQLQEKKGPCNFLIQTAITHATSTTGLKKQLVSADKHATGWEMGRPAASGRGGWPEQWHTFHHWFRFQAIVPSRHVSWGQCSACHKIIHKDQKQPGHPLLVNNSSPIRTYGTCTHSLNLATNT